MNKKGLTLFSCVPGQDGWRYLVEPESHGNSLVVRGVVPRDAGLYTCQVEMTIHIKNVPNFK